MFKHTLGSVSSGSTRKPWIEARKRLRYRLLKFCMKPTFILTPWFPRIRILIHFISRTKLPFSLNPKPCFFLCLMRGFYLSLSPSKHRFNAIFDFKNSWPMIGQFGKTIWILIWKSSPSRNLELLIWIVYILGDFFIHSPTCFGPFISSS